MGCLQSRETLMVELESNEQHGTDLEHLQTANEAADVDNDNGEEFKYEITSNYEVKTIERAIASKSEESYCELNTVTLRMTNEISMLLHRNFDAESMSNSTAAFLQQKRLGSWWYSAIKTHQYAGIAMINHVQLHIEYEEDGRSPRTKMDTKLELVSALLFRKIDFRDHAIQISFAGSDFAKYVAGEYLTENPFFSEPLYDEHATQHMTDYQQVVQSEKGQQCATKKQFEYIDNLDVMEKRLKLHKALKIDVDDDEEQQNCFIYISDMCTDEAYRQKGIASLLWRKLFALYDKGTRFAFHVKSDNHVAQQLYFRLGFQHVANVPDYYGKGVPAWKMVLIL
mmetsp:Transcript_45278/g.72348  ORF Transcript_45278/g.72348 Transcript_45278/m.72348 type:complete len:340 (+) Transcript_45278:50-1069(+)